MTDWTASIDARAALGQHAREWEAAMESGATAVVDEAQGRLYEDSHMASGELHDSIRVEDAQYLGEVVEVTVLVGSDHASDFEYGTEPHHEPYDKLLQWALDKDARGMLRGGDPEAAAAIAQKAIERRGTYPTNLFDTSLHASEPEFVKRAQAKFGRGPA